MKNVFILGAGRSGTSLVAGCLATAGYHMGIQLLEPREANPKGFFESVEINEINEEILARYTPLRPPYGKGRFLFRHRPLHMQRWLAKISPSIEIQAPDDLLDKARSIVEHQPFCLKDPRFCYTLPVWCQLVDDQKTVFICVFRDPATTVESILKECKTFPPLADYHSGIYMTRRRALDIWCAMYGHIIIRHMLNGHWLFIHYEQLFTIEGMRRLKKLTEAKIDTAFPSRSLQRSFGKGHVPSKARKIYRQLCEKANFTKKTTN